MRARFVGRIAVLLALGCGSSAKDTGAPNLVSVFAQVPGAPDVDLLVAPDGGAAAVPGVATFRLVFDKLLDGDKIETVGTGVMPHTDVITITWVNAPAGAPAVVANTFYDPSGASDINKPAPKILLRPSPGLPSGAQLVLKLDRSKITSKANTPFAGPETLTVATLPFEVTTDLMPGLPVAVDQVIKLSFTNAPAPSVAGLVQVSGAKPIELGVMVDPMDARNLLISAKEPWPQGQELTLTIGKAAADQFGVTLAQDFSMKFTVASGDGGVAMTGDGGASDGAVPTDAPATGSADAGVVDVAAPDAGPPDTAAPDAGADDATGG